MDVHLISYNSTILIMSYGVKGIHKLHHRNSVHLLEGNGRKACGVCKPSMLLFQLACLWSLTCEQYTIVHLCFCCSLYSHHCPSDGRAVKLSWFMLMNNHYDSQLCTARMLSIGTCGISLQDGSAVETEVSLQHFGC